MTNSIIKHDITSSDAQAMQQMRAMLDANPKLTFEPASRAAFDGIMGQAPAPEDVTIERGELGGVPGWWTRPTGATKGSVILYLHGGGYVIGSADAYRNFAGQIAKRAGAAAFVADYALAPERPFPAAANEVQAMHKALLAQGYERIAIAGDSAGGGLALSAAADADAKAGKIVGVVAMSPWIDMALSGRSFATRADADPLLSRDTLAEAARLYLGTTNPSDDRLPRIDKDLSKMPPVRIHVGDAEVLLDDSLRFAEQAEKQGVESAVHVWEGMTHVFPSSFAMLEAGAEALADIGSFLAGLLNKPAKKRVLVLGATGGTGRGIVKTLNERRFAPVALVRSPEKARDLDAVIVKGDASDPAAIARALDNVDAVISALGTPASPFREVTLLSTATKALTEAMRNKGVKRLVAITGIGAGESRGHGGFLFDRIIMPLLLRKVYADKDRQETIIAGSGLDYVIVRPAVLNDKPRRGTVRALLDLGGFHGGTIARSDVADFVVDQVENDAFLGKRPLVTW
ncbi:Acetyl esterase/lipase [Consotaella salsifontis]|uniref:Acetyl esterase/lipase n=2 Tax=Consotaella salsifontis TaxID=1365950 RepID=A0A1T4T254_9HYPH|nr:Acetyl esterase/lipase [Consotaella salsifontis]